MSSVWNYVPNRSMAVSLRAAPFSSRSLPKGCPYSTSFRPIYADSLELPTNAFGSPSNSTQPGTGTRGTVDSADPSSCEFWCSSRLHQSQLNKQPLPSKRVLEPWAPIAGCEGGTHAADSSHKRFSKPSRQTSHRDGFPNNKMGVSKRPWYRQPSSSDYLIDTIQNVVLSSRNTGARNWTFSEKSQQPLRASLTSKQRLALKRARKTSLQRIIADYIQLVDPVLQRDIDVSRRPHAEKNLDHALLSMLRDGYIDYLEIHKYNIADVMAWAWVLKSYTTYDATLRIFLLEADRAVKETAFRPSIPAFIPLMLLRQELDLKTFRLLLVYSLHFVTGRPVPRLHSLHTMSNDAISNNLHNDDHINAMPSIDYSRCTMFVVRLLHHARRLWPEAQLSISQAFAFYLRNSDESKGGSFMAKNLNTFLELLSLPPGPRPFVSASVQQQAQFELLKATADKHPVPPVTRRGYQGLAAVQLAQKKTAAERESAELKTPSWPPWKEERSGIDSNKGMEGTKSRAMRVMSQMKGAGYPHSLWEDATGILAGWDTDNSPTIQTRTLARPAKHLRSISQREDHHAIWEARVRSTRTVREAWACFTAYESRGLPPHASVYAAMGEKLIFGKKALKRHLGRTSFELPGDGPEVFPEPASARDWIYTPTEPPTLREFLKKMLSQGIRPSGRFLALLLHHAPSFRVGLDCLNCSDLTNQQLRVLFSFGEDIPDVDAESQKALDEIPDYLFSAFIRLLCRFSVITKGSLRISDIATADAFPIITNNWTGPLPHIPTLFAYADRERNQAKTWYSKLLSHAIRLLRRRGSQNPRGWIQLLSGLHSTRILGDPDKTRRHTQMILAWHEILEVLKWLDERNIEIGSDGFQILCHSFSDAVVAGVKDQDSMDEGREIVALVAQRKGIHPELALPSFEDMVHAGLTTLKGQFDRLVLLDPKTSPFLDSPKLSLEKQTEGQVTVPVVLPHVFSPAVLHAFVRSLGLAEDSDGLLSLLRWMSQHAPTLRQMSDEYSNGDKMMRRTVVAARMFLVGYWGRRWSGPTAYDFDSMDHVTPSNTEMPTFSDPTLQEAYDIVTATEVWGPWPSDEEVWDYLAHEKRATE
ncbi:hypothetical protein BDW62DRAFT_180629 [Aspergillus aurantiobrunneus]